MEKFQYAALGALTALASLYLYDYVCHNKKKGQRSENKIITSESNEETQINEEQLTRVSQFFSENDFDRIKSSFVIVVGLGGVGSHCVTHLVRSGVGKIRVIDFDQVTLSSLNRHAVALRSDVGSPKVTVIKSWAKKIFPNTIVEDIIQLFNAENADQLLEGNPDFVVDCIDHIHSKIDLLRICKERNIKVVSSMGSACKANPSLIQVADISKTKEDKLARTVRYKLKQHRITKGIPVVFSTEKPQVTILPLTPEENPEEFAPLPTFRVRVLPVLGPLPAMFGSALASIVLCDLANFDMNKTY